MLFEKAYQSECKYNHACMYIGPVLLILFSSPTAITCMPLTANGDRGISVTYSPNAKDTNDNYYYGTIATYSCSPGFVFIGIERRVCLLDDSSRIGMFNGSDPTCECETINGMIIL